MEEMNAAVMASTSKTIQLWINWMALIFLASLLFVWKHKSARYILLVFILSIPVALFIFELSQNVHLLGITHILVWTPLAIYLVKTEIMGNKINFKSSYGLYLILFLATVLISLVFDVRDIVLVSMGLK